MRRLEWSWPLALTRCTSTMQGVSSNNHFWAEFAKPAGKYIDGFAETAQGLDPQQSLIMDYSASTFAFYWSAGESGHQPC